MQNYQVVYTLKVKIGRERTFIIEDNNKILPAFKREPPPKEVHSKNADENYRKRMRARSKIIRERCENSFDVYTAWHATLTFDGSKIDAQKLDVVHNEFAKFIKRVKRAFDNFAYVATFARQENGNWHYHMVCNFPLNFTERELSYLWENGRVKIKKIRSEKHFKNTINYLIKNLMCNAEEKKGKKGYMYSQNTEKDKVICSWRDEDTLKFEEVTNKIMKDGTGGIMLKYRYYNKNGSMCESIDIETGQKYMKWIGKFELGNGLKQLGFQECISKFSCYDSMTRFEERFLPITSAERKPKEDKGKSSKKRKSAGRGKK